MLKAKDLAQVVLHKIISGEDMDDVLVKMKAYIDHMGRTDLYPHVLSYTKILLEQSAKSDIVRIKSPYEISASATKAIVAKVTDDKKVAHEVEIDKMIGGFEVEYKDRKIGLNLKTNLDQFKKHLIK